MSHETDIETTARPPYTMSPGGHWLNPPPATRPDDEPALIQLYPEELQILRELVAVDLALVEARTDAAAAEDWLTDEQVANRDRSRWLSGISSKLEYAGVDPDKANLSRDASWHPSNENSRMMITALTHFARWAGGVSLVYNAVEYAAAIEADRKGWPGVQDVAAAAIRAGTRTTDSRYGRVGPDTDRPGANTAEYADITAARAARAAAADTQQPGHEIS